MTRGGRAGRSEPFTDITQMVETEQAASEYAARLERSNQ
jgi:hypothetical protein